MNVAKSLPSPSGRNWGWVLAGVGAALVIGLRWLMNPGGAQSASPLPFLDAVYALVLLGLTLPVAAGSGSKVLRWVAVPMQSSLDRVVWSLSLGLGVFSLGVLGLGLLGALEWYWLVAGWLLAGIWARHEVRTSLGQLSRLRIEGVWRQSGFEGRSLMILSGGLLLLTLLQALAPPWDVDGLIYHLQGPRQFLEAGRILPLPENWLTFYPFQIQMLFLYGLSLGSDVFARLVNLSYSLLLALFVFQTGRRWWGARLGGLAVAILLGIPILPIWASAAYVDMGWALYEFLALVALLEWKEAGDESGAQRWLVLSGLALGMAAGSKYLALPAALVFGMWVIWISWRHARHSKPLQHMIVNGMLFGGAALITGGIWYLKNWLWAGSPFYPLLFNQDASAARVELWTAYMRSFGSGQGILDYLLLPVCLYTQHERFSTFMGSIEILSFLFPLILLYPIVRHNQLVNSLLLLSGLRFAAWAVGSQQTRFLLPLFPAFSLLAAYVLHNLGNNKLLRQRTADLLAVGLAGGMLVVTLIYAVLYFGMVQPLGVIVGTETRQDFLQRNVSDNGAVDFVQTELASTAQVLMLWDARGYYCDGRCLPDIDHARWTEWVSQSISVEEITARLREIGATHLLVSESDRDFLLAHDPSGDHLRAWNFFSQVYAPECTHTVYEDEQAQVVELTCTGQH